MLNQIITVLVISLFTCIGGWYLGALCQRRVDDREKERLIERHRNEMARAFGAQNDDTEPFPDPDILESHRRRIGDVVAANSHCVKLISEDLKNISSIVHGSLVDLLEFRGFRTRIMDSAVQTHGEFDRFLRFVRSPAGSLELLSGLIESLREIEAQSIRVRSIAAEVKLLATNASMEASRVGESGRGFSAFAECMRRLSDDSTGTIMDIYGLVDKTRENLERLIELSEPNHESEFGAVADAPEGFGELDNELTRLDQLMARSISSLELGASKILDLEHKVHAISDSLANGLAEMYQDSESMIARSEAGVGSTN